MSLEEGKSVVCSRKKEGRVKRGSKKESVKRGVLAALPCYGRTETRNAHEKEPESSGKRSRLFQDQDGAGAGAVGRLLSLERSSGGKVALNHCYTQLSEAERAKKATIKARAGGIVSKPGESFPRRTTRLHLFSLTCSQSLFSGFVFPLDNFV